MSQYVLEPEDDTMIEASAGTPFYDSLNCTPDDEFCQGTAADWIKVKFPTWSAENIKVCRSCPRYLAFQRFFR